MYAGDDFYDDDVTSGFDRCVACDGKLGDNDHSGTVCDECSGLAHCVDDICYGQGWCMHVKDAWRA
jgi:hypothetical protein